MTRADFIAAIIKASLVASGGLKPVPLAYAGALADEATASPIFVGPDGAERTAALALALSWMEGGNNPAAIGDCKIPYPENDGKWHPCTTDRIPQSFCALQVHLPGGSHTAEGWSSADLLTDPVKCVRAGLRIAKVSIVADPTGSCPLCMYAGGAVNTVTRRLSENRMQLAKKLLKEIVP